MRLKQYLIEYGKDAKKDFDFILTLTSKMKNTSNKKELEKILSTAKEVSNAWGFKYGHGISDNFHRWLKSKAGL